MKSQQSLVQQHAANTPGVRHPELQHLVPRHKWHNPKLGAHKTGREISAPVDGGDGFIILNTVRM